MHAGTPCKLARGVKCLAASRSLTMIRPDDWHLHLRDGAGLKSVVPHTARHFGRAVIMPNLVPPVTTASQVHDEVCNQLAHALVQMCVLTGWYMIYIVPGTGLQAKSGKCCTRQCGLSAVDDLLLD